MITRLAHAIVRHRKGVLAGSLVVGLLASFAYGGKVSTKLNNGGFADPNAESTIAQPTSSTPSSTPAAPTWCSSSPPAPARSTARGRRRRRGRP